MDTKVLVEKLNKIFCDSNKGGKNYTEAWLEGIDLGGLYHSDKFILNVRASRDINDCGEEIRHILRLLYEKAKKELEYIQRVNVYTSSDEAHCVSGDLLVFADTDECN